MMTPAAIASALHTAIDEGLALFDGAEEARTAARPAPGKWCAREVLGHLIDSACNNHRRFVMAQSGTLARFDGYEQEHWVATQRYHEVPWRDLTALWAAYNRHLAHVIGRTAAPALAHAAVSPDGDSSITLGFVMEDYVAHMRHHLDQIRDLLAR